MSAVIFLLTKLFHKQLFCMCIGDDNEVIAYLASNTQNLFFLNQIFPTAMLVVSAWSMQRTWKEVVVKDCQARILNRKDAVGRNRWRKLIEDVLQDVCEWVNVSSGAGPPR